MASKLSDKELRSRVKLLGSLLGNVLHAQAGGRVLKAVEMLRKGYIGLRKQPNPRKRHRLAQLINTLDTETLSHVIRAFSTYFSLVNIAEEDHQHRQRRLQVRAGGPLWVGSFDHTLRQLYSQGVKAEQLQSLLDRLAYIPVITAHPTESKRQTIMEALRRIFVTSSRLNDSRLGKREREEVIEKVESQIQILWKTDEVRVQRPQVRDEIKNGLLYFHECLFQAVPTTYRYLEQAIERTYGKDSSAALRVPSFMRFGSWIGGDRDGNPNVKPETTALALRLQARAVLLEYLNRVTALSRILTFSSQLCTPTAALLESIKVSEQLGGKTFSENQSRFSHEPYRRKLYIIRHRLDCNLRTVRKRLQGEDLPLQDGAYATEQELLDDLYLIHDSLCSHGDRNIAEAELKDLIRLVETFGFFLLRLDVRQESSRHTRAVAELFAAQADKIDYLDLNEAERIEALTTAIVRREPLLTDPAVLSPETQESLEVLRVMARMRAEVSPQAFGSYVISMTHQASHVLEVMLLARLAGLAGRNEHGWFCTLQITPLFETIEDLTRIEPLLTALLDNPTYLSLLKASGNLQEVMLGYSDSSKDGGILASAWNLYEAQKKITALTAARNIECRLFHGRGGTIGRGGGPTHESILAQPQGTVRGQIKFTEQGEMVSYKYSNIETAVYELSVGVTGLMKASRSLIQPPGQDNPDYLGIMNELAQSGETTYRDLTDRTPGLLDYFYQATPINEIGQLNIGSRPSHRNKADRSKNSIRAIAWVFGWAQSRHTLPAWYGIGAALQRWQSEDPRRLAQLQAMYRDWPFFRALLSNTQMALFKADMDIAKDYAGLCEDIKLAERIYPVIQIEYERTVKEILKVAKSTTLLDENPPLALSLSRRNPYLDPLNAIQLTLLRRYRDPNLSEATKDVWLMPLLRSINAIAAGMRNTG
ncbi:MAG TPA: phosphoenolpyruvate carboxylase [Gammaproteobacteria bacterium]|nr:phosphoenolpyruvate carboxylase [Gammaproteobacteria bacterium]